MSIFSGFNRLNNSISNAFGNIRQVSQTINGFTANLDRVVGQFQTFSGNSSIGRAIGEISDTVRNVRNTLGVVDNLINGGRGNVGNVGTAIRMIGNAAQNVGYNAAPPSRNITRAIISPDISTADASDWRVSLSVPEVIMDTSGILGVLGSTGNRMIFPFNPTILLSHTANYSQMHPTHTNYVYHAYENSQVDNITVTGEFIQENETDALYWLACLHYLRTMTKMFYGSSSEPLGNPPPVARLNGYGKYVLNNIPVLITNFTTDLPQDVDYIPCTVAGEINYVPTQCVFTVTCAPNYARRSQARFSLQDYAGGRHIGGDEGFV